MIALLPHCAFLSETSRMIAIARALEARGIPVVIATHGGPYTSVLDAVGVKYTLLEPTMDAARCERFIEGCVRLGHPSQPLQPVEEVRASVASEVEFFRETGVAMAVIGFTLTAYLSTRVVGIPLATSHGGSFVPPMLEHDLMPVPTYWPMPGTHWLPRPMKRWMVNHMPTKLRAAAAFLNKVADELDVERVPSLAAMMLGDLTLVTDVPQILGLPHDAFENWRPKRNGAYRADTRLTCVGPIFARLDFPLPERVEAWLDGKRPTAYVALSSSSPDMIRRVVARVRAAGVRIIVASTIHSLGDLECDDVIVGDVLPSHRIMPRVDVAIVMGGQGSVQTAMASGTPLIGFPLHGEQELNVALAARQGMAIAISPRRSDDSCVTEAVRRILTERSFREAASRVREIYAGWDGPSRAADALIGRLASNSISHRTMQPAAQDGAALRSIRYLHG
jgi:UDP:flavonoid glycosyltransferase YjiC (YdhE family)